MLSLSIVIPTYCRGQVLLDTIHALQPLMTLESELLIVDQTHDYSFDLKTALDQLNQTGTIHWIRLPQPSIPVAMNVGLQKAQGEVVLFLDDDIIPDPNLLIAHLEAQRNADLVAGQVLQPGEQSLDLVSGQTFHFHSTAPRQIGEFMGGNFSIKRSMAIALGGFDENFIGAAYRYEAEFAHRYCQKYGLITYQPQALIHHLRIQRGGTRSHGHHLRTAQPAHTFGAYYYLLKSRPSGWFWQLFRRPLRSIRTKHHLQHPWWIIPSLIAEFRGLAQALWKLKQGPRYADFDSVSSTPFADLS